MTAMTEVALAKMVEFVRIICPENQSRSHHNRCGDIEKKNQRGYFLEITDMG